MPSESPLLWTTASALQADNMGALLLLLLHALLLRVLLLYCWWCCCTCRAPCKAVAITRHSAEVLHFCSLLLLPLWL